MYTQVNVQIGFLLLLWCSHWCSLVGAFSHLVLVLAN